MGRCSPTDEARNVSVLSAMPPFWLGVDAAGNFAFWNPESETELTVSVFMSAGTDTGYTYHSLTPGGDLPARRDSWPLRFSPVDRKRNSLTPPLTDWRIRPRPSTQQPRRCCQS